MNTNKLPLGYRIENLGFKIILFFYLFTWIVPVFKSIPHIPNESIYIYIWLIFGLVVFPKIFISKEFLFCLYFLFLHLAYLTIDNYVNFDERDKTLLNVFFMYSYPISVSTYIIKYLPVRNIRSLAILTLVFLTVSSLTTLYWLFKLPYVSRALAGNDNQEEVLLLLRMNVGSYSFIYLLVLVTPMLIYFYKNSRKIIWALLFLLFGCVIFYAQFTAAIILFIVNVVFTLLIVYDLSFKKYLLSLIIFVLGFFFFKEVFINILSVFSDVLPLDSVSIKIKEVIMSLEGNSLEGTSLEAYNIRYEQTVEAFLKNPIFGGHIGGGHHYWLDMLALYGIMGFLPFIGIFKQFIHNIIRHPFFTKTEKNLLVHSVLIFIAIGLNKNIVLPMPFILFVTGPMLLLSYGKYFTSKYK